MDTTNATNSTLPVLDADADADADTDADEKRIREFVARSQEAQTDPDVLPELHTADLVLINFAGRRLFGRETFAAAMTAALSSPLKDIRTVLEVDDIRFATPDVAIVTLTKTIHDERTGAEGPDPSEFPSAGAMTYVLTREATTGALPSHRRHRSAERALTRA